MKTDSPIRAQLDADLISPLKEYFSWLDMEYAAKTMAKLDPDNDVMGMTQLSVWRCQEIVEAWDALSQQVRYMTAVMVIGVQSGLIMQFPQDYDAHGSFDVEWAAQRFQEFTPDQLHRVQKDAINLVVAATEIVSVFRQGSQEDENEPVH